MRILLLGGSKSGKSMLGQRLTRQLADGGPMIYWATLEPRDTEDRAIVRRHLAERDGWGFGTLERGRALPEADVVTYDIADLTIPLESTDGDTANHVAVITVTFSMNSKDKDYKAYGDLSTRESLIKGEINDVVSSYTLEDIKVSSSEVEQQILERVQKMFDSKFIFNVTLSSALYQ